MKTLKNLCWFVVVAISLTLTNAARADNPPTSDGIIQLIAIAEARKAKYQDLHDLLCNGTWSINDFWDNFGKGFLADPGNLYIDHVVNEDVEEYRDRDFENEYRQRVYYAFRRDHLKASIKSTLGIELGDSGASDAIEYLLTQALNVVAHLPPGDISIDVAALMVKMSFFLRDLADHAFYSTTFDMLDEVYIQTSLVLCYVEDLLTACSNSNDSALCQKIFFYLENGHFEGMLQLIDREISIYNEIIQGRSFNQVKESLFNIYRQQYNTLDTDFLANVENHNSLPLSLCPECDFDDDQRIDALPFYQYVWCKIATNLEPQLQSDRNREFKLSRLRGIGYMSAFFFRFDKAMVEELLYRLNPNPQYADQINIDGFIDTKEALKLTQDYLEGRVNIGQFMEGIRIWKAGERIPLE